MVILKKEKNKIKKHGDMFRLKDLNFFMDFLILLRLL